MFLGKRFTDEEIAALEAAEKDIRDKRSYRRLQCLLLRAKHGKPAREIAELLGIAQRTVEEVHRRYFKVGLQVLDLGKAGRKSPVNMTLAQEQALLEDFQERAEAGALVTPRLIRQEYEKRIEKRTAKTTIYRLLNRHGWRKVKPRPRHPKGNTEEQALFKKIRRNHSVDC